MRVDSLPKPFIWRRLHSLMGLWFVLFLMEHLLTNSQAALWVGESGQGFVRAVNFIHNLPYLQVIEIVLLGVPIGLHAVLGIRYLFTSKFNSFPSDGSRPHLNYARNHAYTWQRITSWILLVLLAVHVVKFRFLEYPGVVNEDANPTYYVKVSMDTGLYTVAQRLGVHLYDQTGIENLKQQPQRGLLSTAEQLQTQESQVFDANEQDILQTAQQYQHDKNLVDALSKQQIKPGQVIAATSQFSAASLLTVRDTFKSPYWAVLYTVFVLCACFHAFNGLWTFMLTWGWIIKVAAQRKGKRFCLGLMFIMTFLGLVAVWGSYFINLKS